MLNVVTQPSAPVDPSIVFAALGDPVRRAIVDQLAERDATVGELSTLFPISFQAISKHLKVLESAGVVSRSTVGRTRPVHLESTPLEASANWLEAHRRRVEERYERLDGLLIELKEQK
jgi:DNA-binding transcriptional ArsR family regulator